MLLLLICRAQNTNIVVGGWLVAIFPLTCHRKLMYSCSWPFVHMIILLWMIGLLTICALIHHRELYTLAIGHFPHGHSVLVVGSLYVAIFPPTCHRELMYSCSWPFSTWLFCLLWVGDFLYTLLPTIVSLYSSSFSTA